MPILRLHDQVHQLNILELLRSSTTMSTIPTLSKATVSCSITCTQQSVLMEMYIEPSHYGEAYHDSNYSSWQYDDEDYAEGQP